MSTWARPRAANNFANVRGPASDEQMRCQADGQRNLDRPALQLLTQSSRARKAAHYRFFLLVHKTVLSTLRPMLRTSWGNAQYLRS